MLHFTDLRGTITRNAPIGSQSWFRCGGCADLLFEPDDMQDLQNFLSQLPADQPLTIIGGLANTIVRDGGVRGACVHLPKSFANIDVQGDIITAGAGALNGSIASQAAKNGIGGLEFLSGIPGTLGGSCAMNAGAYGAELKDVLTNIHGLMRNGKKHTLAPNDLKMSYRHGNLPDDFIAYQVTLRGILEDEQTVRRRLKEIKEKRSAAQPIKDNTGGSTFANPSDDLRAWQVIEKVGGRDLQIGGARMSDKHCNFMVNDGNASAQDLEALGDELIKRAQDQMNITLNWEIKRIGEKASDR